MDNQDGGAANGDSRPPGAVQPLRLMRDHVPATPLVGRIAARLAAPATLRPAAGLLQRTADWAGQIARRFALRSTRPNTPLTLIARLAYGPDVFEAEEGLFAAASAPRSPNAESRAASQPVIARRVAREGSPPASTLRRTPFDPRVAPLDTPAAAEPAPANLQPQRTALPRVRPVAQRAAPGTRLPMVQRLDEAPVGPEQAALPHSSAAPAPPTTPGSTSRPALAEQARLGVQPAGAGSLPAPLQRTATSTTARTPGQRLPRDPRIARPGPLQRTLLGGDAQPLEQPAPGSDAAADGLAGPRLGALRPVALSLQRVPLVSSSGASLSSRNPRPSAAASLPLLSSGLIARTASPVAATTSGVWRNPAVQSGSTPAASPPPRTVPVATLGALRPSPASATPGEASRLGSIAPLRQALTVQRVPMLPDTRPADTANQPATAPSSQAAGRNQPAPSRPATNTAALLARSALPLSRVASGLPSAGASAASTGAANTLPVVQTLRRLPDATPNAPHPVLSRFTQQTRAGLPLLRSALSSPAKLPDSTGNQLQRTVAPAPSGTTAAPASFGGLRAAATAQSLLARMRAPAQETPATQGVAQPAAGETAGLRSTLQRSTLPSPAQLVLLRSPITPVGWLAAEPALPALPRSAATGASPHQPAGPPAGPAQRVVARPNEASLQGMPPQTTGAPRPASVQRTPRLNMPVLQQQPVARSAALSPAPANFRPIGAQPLLLRTSIVPASPSVAPQPHQPRSGATTLLSRAWSSALPEQARTAPGAASQTALPMLRTALPQGPHGDADLRAGGALLRSPETQTTGLQAPVPLLMRAALFPNSAASVQLPSPGSPAQPANTTDATFPLLMRSGVPATISSVSNAGVRASSTVAPFPLLRATTPLAYTPWPSAEDAPPPVQRSPLAALPPVRTASTAGEIGQAGQVSASGFAPVQRIMPFPLLQRSNLLASTAPQASREAAPGGTFAQQARASTAFPLLMRTAAPQPSTGPLPVDGARPGAAFPLLMRTPVSLAGGDSTTGPAAPSMLGPIRHSAGGVPFPVLMRSSAPPASAATPATSAERPLAAPVQHNSVSAPFPLLLRMPALPADAGTPQAAAAQSAPATVQSRATAATFPLLTRAAAPQPSGALPLAEAPGLMPTPVQRSASAPFPLLLRAAPQPSGSLPATEAPGMVSAPVQRSASAPFPLLMRTSSPQPSGGLPATEAPGMVPAPVQRSASAPFPLLMRAATPQPSGSLPAAEVPDMVPAPVQRSASAPFPLLMRAATPQPSGSLPAAEAPGMVPAPVQRSASAPFPLLMRAAVPQTDPFASTFSSLVPAQHSSAGYPFPLLMRAAASQPSVSSDTWADAAAPVPALMRAAAPQQRAGFLATEQAERAAMPAQPNAPAGPFPLLMRATLAQTGAGFFAAQPDRPAVAPVQGNSAPFPLLMRAAAPLPNADQPATASTSAAVLMRSALPQATAPSPIARGGGAAQGSTASAPFPLLMRAAAPLPSGTQPTAPGELATSVLGPPSSASAPFPLLMRAATPVPSGTQPTAPGGLVTSVLGPRSSASAPFPLLMRAAVALAGGNPAAAEAGSAAVRTVQRTGTSAPFPVLMRVTAPGAAPAPHSAVSASFPMLMRATPQTGSSPVPAALEPAQHSAIATTFPLLMRAAAPADPLVTQSARPAAEAAPFPAFLRPPVADSRVQAARSGTPTPLLMRALLLQPDAALPLAGPQPGDTPLMGTTQTTSTAPLPVGSRATGLAAPLALPSVARIARTARLDVASEEPKQAESSQPVRQTSSPALFAQRLPGEAASPPEQRNGSAAELPFVQAAGAMQDTEEAAFIETQSTLNPALQRTLSDELRGHAPAAQATSGRMELLRPAASTVQRETATTSASAPESTPAPTASQQQRRGESSAQEIERLAREVYSRLRQRLMVDAERLGR